MARRKRRRHPQIPKRRRKTIDHILRRAEELQEDGMLWEALDVLDEAPPYFQDRPEVLLPRAHIYQMIGDTPKAIDALEKAQSAGADTPVISFVLAGNYFQLNRAAHAARALRRFFQGEGEEPIPLEISMEAKAMMDECTELIESIAEAAELSMEKAEEALFHIETSEALAFREDFAAAAKAAGAAARVAPDWSHPANVESQLCYLSGDARQAIQKAEETLARWPQDTHALQNLIRFHVTLEEREKAEAYANRLRDVPLTTTTALGDAITGFAWLENDQEIYRLYKKRRKEVDRLNPLQIAAVGSAAANLGHPRVARRLWKMAKKEGFPPDIMDGYANYLNDGAPGPRFASRYPTIFLPELLTVAQLTHLGQVVSEYESGLIDYEEAQQEIAAVADVNLNLSRVARSFLWEQGSPDLGLSILQLIGTPEAAAEIEKFAFSQAGPMDLRVYTLSSLVEMGVLDKGVQVSLWNEETEEWQDVYPLTWEIEWRTEWPTYAPEVDILISEASDAFDDDDYALACEKLAAAVALAPDAANIRHDLAIALDEIDDEERARAQLDQALQVDPQHVYSLCTLARWRMRDEEDYEGAMALLAPLFKMEVLSLEKALYFYHTLADLAIAQGDYLAARRHLEMILDLDPEDEEAEDRLDDVFFLEAYNSPYFKEMRARAKRRREKKCRRPTRRDAPLKECLERLTKDALTGTARTMPVRRNYSVRKAILIDDLVAYIANPTNLEQILRLLTEIERDALRDVIEAGGTLPWETFTDRYGDDLDENPSWNYHPPDSVMGRLRMLGLLSNGTVDDELIVLIPNELRPFIPSLLDRIEEQR